MGNTKVHILSIFFRSFVDEKYTLAVAETFTLLIKHSSNVHPKGWASRMESSEFIMRAGGSDTKQAGSWGRGEGRWAEVSQW